MDGYRSAILNASYIKRALLTTPMAADARLEMLETLEALGDHPVGAAAIAAVQPADPIGFKIIYEAMKLDDDESDSWRPGCRLDCDDSGRWHPLPPMRNASKILLKPPLFDNLARLNPSLLAALDLCGFGGPARQNAASG